MENETALSTPLPALAKPRVKLGTIVVYSFLAAVLVTQLFPLLWLGAFSLKSNTEIFGGNVVGLPQVWHWENYSRVLAKGNLPQYFLNSVIISVLAIGLTLLCAALASYAIARLRWKLSKAALVFFLLGLMIPLHAALLPLFLTLQSLKLLNSHVSLIIPYAAYALPVAIFILTGFFETIPREMEESAFMDGASIGRTFWSIMLPLVAPAMATVAIFSFLNTWNELMFATTFVSSAEYKTLPVGIMGLTSQYRTEWGPIGAALIVASLPTVLIYSLLSRQVQEGVRAGAVKG